MTERGQDRRRQELELDIGAAEVTAQREDEQAAPFKMASGILDLIYRRSAHAGELITITRSELKELGAIDEEETLDPLSRVGGFLYDKALNHEARAISLRERARHLSRGLSANDAAAEAFLPGIKDS